MSQNTKYKNDFAKEKYDTFRMTMPKGKKEIINSYRKEKGYKSLNDYINKLIDEDMLSGGGRNN